MITDELLRKANFHSVFEDVKIEHTRKVKYSSKLTPYVDNTRSFSGFEACKTNVLAEKDDSVAMAMCKNRK